MENKCEVTDEDESCLEIVDDRMRVDASDSNDDDDGNSDGDDGDDFENDNDNENEDEEDDDDDDDEGDRSTRRGTNIRSGRVTYRPVRLTDEGVACVGAGIGGGYASTTELKPMKYKEAMRSRDREEWKKAVEEEHNNMKKYNVWTPVQIKDVPTNAKILTSTWAMKKKANGTFRARCNARGYEEVDGVHYDGTSIAAPVTNELSVRILIVMMLMADWVGHVLDVKGAFLRGEFEPNQPPIYIKVPEGFENFYPIGCVLLLLHTIYGLKEAAMAFWREILKAFKHMGYNRSKADSCLYFKWTALGNLIVWLSWVDDCVCFGQSQDVKTATDEMKSLFECDDVGEFEEYVGCQVIRENNKLKLTQPVLIQSFADEFEIEEKISAETPGAPGAVLTPVENEIDAVKTEIQTKFRSGIGKLLHLMRWSRPDICNAVRDLSRHGQKSNKAHLKAMKRCMKYCIQTREMGWCLNPTRKWDGKDRDFQFVINGKSDSDYACCPTTRRSVSGICVFLEEAVVSAKSVMQKIVALSVTEAETIAAVQCAQEMMLTYKIVISMGLKVKLPMMLEVDNKGAVDLANSWSHGGRTKHMQVRNYWLRELKEKGLIKVKWIPGKTNVADMLTKN